MIIQQLYTNCLAQAAYYVESDGEAAIIDPLRDYGEYIKLAESNRARIKYIFETHFHADFVSGHVDLAHHTGAEIIYGPTTATSYPVHVAKDGEELKIGRLTMRVLHTPGHTPESSSFLLLDETGKPHCVFTGDTLFVGDVGRPDLLDGVMSKETLAGMLYDSLRNKLMTLPDNVIVYPAHGAGSACGKNIGKETFSTIGTQKQMNYALQDMSKEEFIRQVTEGIQPAPAYFFKDARLNKQGYAPIEDVLDKGLRPLTPEQFASEMKAGATIIDTRVAGTFEAGFVPGSLNFGLDGQYAIWAATVLDISQPVIIVAEEGREKESIERLARVGFDRVMGFLKGGFEAWKEAGKRYDMVISVDAEEFALDVKHSKAKVIDVRRPDEFNALHVKDAVSMPLDKIINDSKDLDPGEEYFVHCAGGYRSMVASSILKSKGFQRVKNVYGGFGEIKKLDLDFESGKKTSGTGS